MARSLNVGDVVYYDEAQGEVLSIDPEGYVCPYVGTKIATASVRYANGYVSEADWLSDLATEAEYLEFEEEMRNEV